MKIGKLPSKDTRRERERGKSDKREGKSDWVVGGEGRGALASAQKQHRRLGERHFAMTIVP